MTARIWRRFTIALVFALWAQAASATTSERVVVDAISGIAISGYDPVQYFLAGEPQEGSPEHEARWNGAVWRFRNAGNMAAFLAHPNVYAPRFGGHDPVAAARGFVARGDPFLYVVAEERLYLFHTEANLRLFVSAREGFARQAERNWPALSASLAR
jgi:hypothetical protein